MRKRQKRKRERFRFEEAVLESKKGRKMGGLLFKLRGNSMNKHERFVVVQFLVSTQFPAGFDCITSCASNDSN